MNPLSILAIRIWAIMSIIFGIVIVILCFRKPNIDNSKLNHWYMTIERYTAFITFIFVLINELCNK